jgi:hypothetical protein
VTARYGFKPQRWTIVATVGHYSESAEDAQAESSAVQIENDSQDGFSRLRFIRSINSMIRTMAASGMVDLPQHPGMAAIPIAIYRSVQGGPSLAAMPAVDR